MSGAAPGGLEGVLDGVRVVELAGVLAGPSAGQFLAELGADVAKVENARTGGDVTRRWRLPGEAAPDGRTAYFAAANWGKRSVGLDLSREAGRAALHALVRRADVVLTAYRPGAAAALGADVATLAALAPRAVVVALSGYGAGDPRAGYDAVVQAEAGWTGINGAAEGPPTKLPVALMDLQAAHQIKEAVLAGLLRRERTGRGAVVELSLLGAAVSGLANQATAWLQAGRVPRRMGSAHPQIAPYGAPLPTADGPVVLAVGTDRQFARLCGILGVELAADARFATNAARVEHREALHRALAAATRDRPREPLLDELDAAGVPAGAVRTVPEAFAHPEAARQSLRDGELAGVRQAAFAGERALLAPPRYAAHTRAVLAEAGVAEAELDHWEAAGGIVQA